MKQENINSTVKFIEDSGDVSVIRTTRPGKHVKFLVEYRDFNGQPARKWLNEEAAKNLADGLTLLV